MSPGICNFGLPFLPTYHGAYPYWREQSFKAFFPKVFMAPKRKSITDDKPNFSGQFWNIISIEEI